MKTSFTPGLELCKRFYWEEVRPILDTTFPEVTHTAALLGGGSEVLGFDTPLSMDHDWSPRVMLFLGESDCRKVGKDINPAVQSKLPKRFHRVPVEPVGKTKETAPIEILTARNFILNYLGFDIRKEIEPADWLTFPEQKLRTITSGEIFWDGINLRGMYRRFEYYPRDIWLYLLAAEWNRIGQEEHLMGRAGSVGDEIGSALIAARLVRDIMQLCFLMEKQYAPYAKWFGSAFGKLPHAHELTPILQRVLSAAAWTDREKALLSAYEITAKRHNALGITEPVKATPQQFYGRPFYIIGGEKIKQAIIQKIADPAMENIIAKGIIGGIDQISDNTDILCDVQWRAVLRHLFEKIKLRPARR
ncbi:MAG: DUF4037 domain-containing protein [Anaerolineales bacterium]|nr:DUF4037 domain-containing protein [Anaerolineales bacterium]